MTNREFYEAIINANINDELTAFATEGIAKMDKRNEKRSSKPSKVALANEPIKQAIANLITDKGMTASEVGASLEISTQKASALLRQLVEDGVLVATEVKVPKKGKVKSYTHC